MERFWRTLREGCLDFMGDVSTLHDLNVRLWAFLDTHYHQTAHATPTALSPSTVSTMSLMTSISQVWSTRGDPCVQVATLWGRRRRVSLAVEAFAPWSCTHTARELRRSGGGGQKVAQRWLTEGDEPFFGGFAVEKRALLVRRAPHGQCSTSLPNVCWARETHGGGYRGEESCSAYRCSNVCLTSSRAAVGPKQP